MVLFENFFFKKRTECWNFDFQNDGEGNTYFLTCRYTCNIYMFICVRLNPFEPFGMFKLRSSLILLELALVAFEITFKVSF